MFKKLEAVWNARTPVYLHSRTKENFIFQIILGAAVILGMVAYDKWRERRDQIKYL